MFAFDVEVEPHLQGFFIAISTRSAYDRRRELFQFDRADLDFGIYRIMNQRRTEIGTFLDEDLLPQVQQVLATLKDDERERLERELARAYEAEASLGLTRGASQKAKALEARLSDRQSGADREAEVFSDLYTFFSRYYNEGDFISLRRYKAGQSHLTVARLMEGLGVVAEALICITNDADRG